MGRARRAGVLIALASGLALAVAPGASAAGRCGAHAWCDATLPADQRAELLVRGLTLPEKQELLWGDEQFDVPGGRERHTGTNYGIPRLDVPPLYLSDGPVGPRQGAGATAMPAPLGLAAAFDPALAARAGALVAAEAKAKGNDLVYAPTVNLMRTPRGGRTFEGYGEDPFLAGRTAVGWITGAQATGVIASVKHFAVNNQETERMSINAEIDERTLRELYLPQFAAAVKEARAGAVMCAYPKVNGQYACENEHLLKEILNGEWGFQGIVLADYPAAHDTAASLRNGLDFEPSGFAYAPSATNLALLTGRVTEADIDARVRRILRTMFAFGAFDRSAYADDPAQIPVAAHAAVAREVEEGAITLLENRDRALPLDPKKIRTIALIGSDAARFKSGGGSSNVTPLVTVTPKQGLEQRAGPAIELRYDGSDDPARSARTAAGADAAVVVVADSASEGADQPCLRLGCTDGDARDLDAVIEAVAKANPRTIVVTETSGPVLTPWRGSVAALVEAWYPGQSGGAAIARVLFGDVDPGGRLPATFPDREEQLPQWGDAESFPGVGGTVKYKEGVLVGYRWFDERELEPAYPFGHGLSYTSFAFSRLRVVRSAGGTTVSATVKNTGARTGLAVPQLYLGLPDPAEGVTQPPYQLKGFTKFSLAPGASRRVSFTLDARAFSYWDTSAKRWAVAPGCSGIAVGASSRDLPLRQDVGDGCPARASRSCASRRSFVIRLPRALRRARVAVAGKPVRVRRVGRRLTARVDLRGRRTRRVVVTIVGRTKTGKVLRRARTFRPCGRSS